MKLKPLLLIVALLALATALVVWRGRAPAADPSADPRVGQPLVARETLASFRGLRLTSGGQSVTLTADRDGHNWTVPDYFTLPADFSKLVTFVESLRSAKTTRFVTAAPDRIARLDFAGDAIELRDADGKPTWTLHLGRNNETGGRFVRFGDEPKAYLAELSVWLDAVAKNWARSQLLDLKPADVAAVELRFADDTSLTARRNADSTSWTAESLPEGKELKSTTIDSLVSQLGTLRFSETAEPTAPDAIAAREHAQTAVLTMKDGTAYTVALGRRPAPPKLDSGAQKTETAADTPETRNPKPETISATTPPVTIGPDGKVQVVDLPSAAPEVAETAATAAAAPTTPPPPGPVFAFLSANRDTDPVNALMQKRAFQVGEWILNTLPANRDALLQDKPAAPPAAPAATPPAQ
ncbi:MAG: DUF4340 domain-containing protein [Opitutaceae bacterium]|nr:DUF4340 domain-containing protein [Opitutaceae bacterium]